MKKINYLHCRILVVATAAISCTILSAIPISKAEIYEASSTALEKQNKSITRLIFRRRARANEDPPLRRRAGGKYGNDDCPPVDAVLTALVDGQEETINDNETKSRSFLNFTAQARPTFWFFIPYSSNGELEAELILQDSERRLVFPPQRYQLMATPGIVAIPYPSNESGLQINQKYLWTLSIACSSNPYVNGKIERIAAPSSLEFLNSATLEEKIVVYAKEGLWNELLSTLLQEIYPRDRENAQLWLMQLLQEIQLTDISQQPIVESCCIPNQP